MPDLQSMSDEARLAFYFWPILLLSKKRQLEAKLAQAAYQADAPQTDALALIAAEPALALLKRLGFPLPENLTNLPRIPQEHLQGIRFFLRVGIAFEDAHEWVLDFVRQLSNGKYERRELLRMESRDSAYLETAAEKFNAVIDLEAHDLVYRAALLWVSLHDAETRPWQAIAAAFLEAEKQAFAKSVAPVSPESQLAPNGDPESKIVNFETGLAAAFRFDAAKSSLLGGASHEDETAS